LADECEPLIGSSGLRPVGIPETRDSRSVHIVQAPIVAIRSKRLERYGQVCDDQLAKLEQNATIRWFKPLVVTKNRSTSFAYFQVKLNYVILTVGPIFLTARRSNVHRKRPLVPFLLALIGLAVSVT